MIVLLWSTFRLVYCV